MLWCYARYLAAIAIVIIQLSSIFHPADPQPLEWTQEIGQAGKRARHAEERAARKSGRR